MSEVLVNRGLVMTAEDRGLDRFYVEQRKLRTYFPQFSLTGSRGSVTGAQGWLETNSKKRYQVRIALPTDYPHSMPAVYPVGWTPGGAPHQYAGGSLCLMMSGQWHSHWTLAYVVVKTAVWLNKFEVWQRTGRWPGRQQDHGALNETLGILGRFFE